MNDVPKFSYSYLQVAWQIARQIGILSIGVAIGSFVATLNLFFHAKTSMDPRNMFLVLIITLILLMFRRHFETRMILTEIVIAAWLPAYLLFQGLPPSGLRHAIEATAFGVAGSLIGSAMTRWVDNKKYPLSRRRSIRATAA